MTITTDSDLVYVAWSVYTIVLGLIKASLVLFYLEIFPSPRVRIVGHMILGWIVVNSLIIFLLTVFNCRPVNAFWDRDLKGKCIDINALAYANSGSAITQDIVLLIFPLTCIRQLKMERHRKVAVGLMFAIGTLTTIDPTWDYVPVTIWTEIELACGYVCVSLPAIRVLLSRVFPKSMFASISRSRNGNDRSTPQKLEPMLAPKPIKKKRRESSWMRITTATMASDVEPSPMVWPLTPDTD
ncbi:hypothetical protein N0V90_011269 [Kalmusia sp. IMI 367209]|nr:hypothetical protein N0V90_011269 [Kalmusia sp. IMI 367209]